MAEKKRLLILRSTTPVISDLVKSKKIKNFAVELRFMRISLQIIKRLKPKSNNGNNTQSSTNVGKVS